MKNNSILVIILIILCGLFSCTNKQQYSHNDETEKINVNILTDNKTISEALTVKEDFIASLDRYEEIKSSYKKTMHLFDSELIEDIEKLFEIVESLKKQSEKVSLSKNSFEKNNTRENFDQFLVELKSFLSTSLKERKISEIVNKKLKSMGNETKEIKNL